MARIEEHIYDNMKNTEEGMAKLKSFEEEYSKGTLVNWRTLRKEADLKRRAQTDRRMFNLGSPEVSKLLRR